MNQDLNQRTQTTLDTIDELGPIDVSQLGDELVKEGITVSKATLNRDLALLQNMGLVEKIGVGKATRYQASESSRLLQPVDVDKYMKSGRRMDHFPFNFEVFSLLSDAALLSVEEIASLERLRQGYLRNVSKMDPSVLKRELERLTIDLSWKSSVIEGNTYDLLETEHLLKEGVQAKGKPAEDAYMLLNHKQALEYIRQNVDEFKVVSRESIFKVHELLVANLKVGKGLRKSPVGITGTNYEPLGQKLEIGKALDLMITLINRKENLFEKALIALLLTAYIQPFADGNKRTSRMLANAILLAHDSFPLSFRSIDVLEYKKAVLIFYEVNNLSYFKQLFIEQYNFAGREYFHVDAQ